MGTKTVPAKPSELIILAINNLEEKDGSSTHDIVKFITQEFKMKAEEVTPRVQEALKRAMTYGILSQKGGKYKIQDIPKLEVPEGSSSLTEEPPGPSKPEPEKLKLIGKKSKRRGPAKRTAKKRKKALPKIPKDVRTRRESRQLCKRCLSKAMYPEISEL